MPASGSDALTIAQQHFHAGRLAAAEALYRQALASHPQDLNLLSWLALITDRLGRPAESIAYYEQILTLNPQAAEAHSNLGAVLCRQGQLAAAIDHHRQALALMPADADAHYNLGVALYEAGEIEAAIAAYQQTVKLKPNHVHAHSNLGMALYRQGNLEASAVHYQQAIALHPDHFNAHNGLGVVLFHLGQLEAAITHYQRAIALNPAQVSAYNNLGTVLQRQGKLPEAMALYQRAIALKPDYASAHDNLGTVLQEQGQLEAAIAHYRQAIDLDPKGANAYNNLGSALKEQGLLEAAAAACREALRLQPDHADAHNNYASSLVEQGRFQEAIDHYEQALHYQPDHVNAHLNLGIILLMQGNLQRGFREYHWRWRSKQCPDLRYPQALWDGSDLTGKVILLTAEQGFGDTIQFARYAPLVAQRGGCVVVACQKPLLRLLSSLKGIDQCVDRDQVNVQTHCHAPLLDLPLILGTTLESIPAAVPYLSAAVSDLVLPKPNQVAGNGWQGTISSPHPTLHTPPSLKIGIVWASNPDNSTAKKRSCPLPHFLELLEIPGVSLYSLQKDLTDADSKLLESQPTIQDLRPLIQDFADTAAAIAQLDLVISVDTAVAHLAGALGKPVWTLLPFVADWRWLLDQEHTPWYPTMRLFRQTQAGDWAGVFARVSAALRGYGVQGTGYGVQGEAEAAGKENLFPTPHCPLPIAHYPLPIACRHGTFLDNPADAIGQALELYGEWYEGEVALFQSLLRSGDTVVEVGANIGAHTVFLAKAVGTGRVVAIEPERLQFQRLCANLALNGIINVYSYSLLLGEPKTAPVPRFHHLSGQGQGSGGDRLEQPQIRALDHFELSHCRLFKIDQPGRELQILTSAIDTIQRCQPILYVRNNRSENGNTWMQFLEKLGYDLYWHPSSPFNLNNFFQRSQNIWGNTISVNILGFPHSHRVRVKGMGRVQLTES